MRELLKRVVLRLLDQPIGDLVREAIDAEPLPTTRELDTLRAEVDEANVELERLTAELERLSHALDRQRAEEPLPVKPGRKTRGCKLPGCAGKHRSKGFCSKHYAAWRRERLEGYVGPDGRLSLADRAWTLDTRLAGEAFTIESGRVLVKGEVVGSA